MESKTYVTLNLQAPNVAVVVHAKQNDKLTRKIVAQLADGSASWTPPAGAGAVIRYCKPDGTGGFYDTDENGDPAIIVSGNTATLTMVEQSMTVPGAVFCELNFYAPDGSKLTAFTWVMNVQASVLADATIVSSDYYNVLTQQVAAAVEAAEQAAAIAANLPVPSTSNPLKDSSTPTPGTSAAYARGDHVHPLPSGLQGIHFLTAQISSNGSIDVNISGTSAGVFWISGQALNRMGRGIWSSNSNGVTITSLTPVDGTNLTVTDGTGKFTLSNANSVLVRVLIICFNGSAPTIS